MHFNVLCNGPKHVPVAHVELYTNVTFSSVAASSTFPSLTHLTDKSFRCLCLSLKVSTQSFKRYLLQIHQKISSPQTKFYIQHTNNHPFTHYGITFHPKLFYTNQQSALKNSINLTSHFECLCLSNWHFFLWQSTSQRTKMASVQDRLKLKRVPLDKWSVSEQLYLASAVSCSGIYLKNKMFYMHA